LAKKPAGATSPEVKSNFAMPNYKNYFVNNIAFGHKIEEHNSWGVTFNHDANGKITGSNAKIFTYPDLAKAEIEIAQDGDKDFLKDFKNDTKDAPIKRFELKNVNGGTYEAKNVDIKPGERYRFKLTFKDGQSRYISDLYSYSQKGLTDWPVAYDQMAYELSSKGKKLNKFSQFWNKGLIKGKVNNIKAESNPAFINSKQLRLMQLHVGTFTKNGDFASLVKQLDDVKETGFNGIELLPHGYFNKTNWGYDPSFVFASQYGGTDKFKELCDEAHKRGLNVIVDLVNNHYSMDHPEIMTKAGPYENPDPAMKLEFGPRINYRNEFKEGVRDWRANEPLYWLKYADGARFDLTDFTGSGEFNTEMNIEIQEHFPGTATFAESASTEASNPLPKDAVTNNLPLNSKERTNLHESIINRAERDEFGGMNQGFSHRWHFGWSHATEYTLLHPFDRKIEDLKNKVYDAQNHMKILFSHDEIGKQEADGNDIVVKSMLSKLFGSNVGDLGWGTSRAQTEKYWKASRALRELTRRYLTDEPWPDNEMQLKSEKCLGGGNINDFNNPKYGIPDYKEGGLGLGDLGWTKGISKEEFGEKFAQSCNLNKAAMGFLYSQPGPKMVFQTYNTPDRRFGFFRKNSEYFYETFNRNYNLAKGVDWETERKGHRLDADEIINQAKMHELDGKYNQKALDYKQNIKNLVKALNKVNAENAALTKGEVKDVVGNHKDAISILSKYKDNEIYAITNFDEMNSYDKYKIYFPEGTWKEILNTDSKEFGGKGLLKNAKEIISHGDCEISLPKACTLLFKRIK
jgi:1,4-alpha-glucan branching enzyme